MLSIEKEVEKERWGSGRRRGGEGEGKEELGKGGDKSDIKGNGKGEWIIWDIEISKRKGRGSALTNLQIPIFLILKNMVKNLAGTFWKGLFN